MPGVNIRHFRHRNSLYSIGGPVGHLQYWPYNRLYTGKLHP